MDAPDPVAAAHSATTEMLALVQSWLAAYGPGGPVLAVLTRGAVARTGEDVTDLAGAAVWGLVRSAIAEHPGRFVLADLDGSEASRRALPAVLASGEPQVLVRDGTVYAGLLIRPRPADGPEGSRFGPDGTVLVTGATGALGGPVARHLAARGVRHLLLASRSGTMPGWAADLDAEVTVAACDVASRADVARLIGGIPAGQPLTGVVHLAGVLDDALIGDLSPDQVDAVLRPKADAAWHLHELTKDQGLTAFVLFSSVTGLIGNEGQGNYAAANAFLDGLAAHRRAHGWPGQSLAWGRWAPGGPAASNGHAVRRPSPGGGMAALPAPQALAVFDAACERPEALLAPMKLEISGSSGPGDVPHEFRALVPSGRRAAARTSQDDVTRLREQLAGLAASEQDTILRRLVADHAAALLGYGDTEVIDPDRHFLEAGFDSLTAVELRNSLCAVTGLRLPATVAFDLQTPAGLAARLREELGNAAASGVTQVPAPAADPVSDGLKQLFSEALRSGQVQVGLDILSSSANLRRSFQVATDPGDVPPPVRLTEGTRTPRVFCVATPVAMGGPYQYARLAAHFRGRRELSVLSLPGFLAGQRLPAWPVPRSTRSQKACGGLPVANRSRCSATRRPASWRMPPPPGWNGRDIRQRR